MAYDDPNAGGGGSDESFADRQARLAAKPNPAGGYGNAAYDQVGNIFQQATGRAATQQEVSQWGTNLDSNYLNNIRNAVGDTAEAKAYRASQNTPAVTPTVAPPPKDAAAPNTPVTASGGIPPAAPPAPAGVSPVSAPAAVKQAAPQAVGAAPDARTIGSVAGMPTYTGANFANTLGAAPSLNQFNGPNQSANDAQQSSLMAAILAHPETMGPEQIAQLKEQQKEQALLLGQQSNASFAQGAVGRGTLNSGNTDMFRAQGDQNINNAILGGNRAVDLAALATNRNDQLNALTASSGLAQDQLGRATSAYGTGLTGQQAQDASNITHATYGTGIDQANAAQKFLGYQSEADANNAAFQRALSIAKNAQDVYGQDLAAQFGNQSSNLDLQKFLESQQQYQSNLAAQKDQFGQTLKFNYNQLDQNGNLMQNQQLLNTK